jgi:hypothetical protein
MNNIFMAKFLNNAISSLFNAIFNKETVLTKLSILDGDKVTFNDLIQAISALIL